MGISTQLDDVLSFPLGSNSISILEASLVYHTILSGTVYRLGENGHKEYTPVIQKIVDRDGEVIYEYHPRGVRVLDDKISNMVTPILRQAVKHGTGRGAEGNICVRVKGFEEKGSVDWISFKVPAFGKTGTSNEFTNSSFCGFIPGEVNGEKGLTINNSYVIASYVGYDNNRPLANKHVKIYGASGALPVWIDTANSIVRAKKYSECIDHLDMVFEGVKEVSLPKTRDMISVPVNTATSLPVKTGMEEGGTGELIIIDSYGMMNERGFEPQRFFLPFP